MWELPNDWNELLKEEMEKDYFKKIKTYIEREYEEQRIFPRKDEVFKALELTSCEDTKVLVLGQDCYQSVDKNGNKHAMGVCFSSPSQYQIPPSLTNIYKELENDIEGFKKPNHANLIKWAEQGVLLLNTILTVRAGVSNSHKGVWEPFTTQIIKLLGESDKPMSILLWGNQAKKYERFFTGKNKLILKGTHPSPLSCNRAGINTSEDLNENQFFGNRYFSRTNQFLIENKLTPINWQV